MSEQSVPPPQAPPPQAPRPEVPPPPTSGEVREKLGVGKPDHRWRWRILGLLLVLLLGGLFFWRRAKKAAEPTEEYITKSVKRGSLDATITATGNLRGRDTVEVGAEVSGTVRAVHVDFNDAVKEGQVLCEIDPQELHAQRDQNQAQLTAARASYQTALATAKETKVNVERSRKLAKDGLISQQELEAAEAAAVRAKASARSAAAQVTVSRATLVLAGTKIDKTKILAPMDGIVLSRTVEVGQTVAASLQAPVLFVVARNLKQMDLTVAIDEADIGQVREGQNATFTVDAFVDRKFDAELRSIHNIGTTVNNVVSYDALLTVSNDDLSLRPGMTATATIITSARKDVLLVPNAALRFRPGTKSTGRTLFSKSEKKPRPEASAAAAGKGAQQRSQVWVLVDGKPKSVPVDTRHSDGQFTEIEDGAIDEGAEVIVDMKKLTE